MSNIKLPEPVELAFVKYEPSSGLDHSKAPILIHHGIFSSKEAWKIGQEIANHTKHVVICLDARDHGDSPKTQEFTFQAMISDQVQFFKTHKIEKAMLIGHSLGGMIYSRFATLFVSNCILKIKLDNKQLLFYSASIS